MTWKRNIFVVPSGALRKKFVDELAQLFHTYAEASALEGVALYAAMVMPVSSATEIRLFLREDFSSGEKVIFIAY